MKRTTFTLCLTLMVGSIVSCAAKPVPPPPRSSYVFEKEAIRLDLKADPQLNLYESMAHTLSVCVYQLRDPNAVNQLLEDKDGIYKLLECNRFDPSVVSSKRLIVNPGEEKKLALDRAEGARYVAVVAGYYSLYKEGMVRLYDIPWHIETRGFFRRTKVSKPSPLDIDLVLGSQQLESSEGK